LFPVPVSYCQWRAKLDAPKIGRFSGIFPALAKHRRQSYLRDEAGLAGRRIDTSSWGLHLDGKRWFRETTGCK